MTKNKILWTITGAAAITFILCFLAAELVADSGNTVAVIIEFVAIIVSGTWLYWFGKVNRKRLTGEEVVKYYE